MPQPWEQRAREIAAAFELKVWGKVTGEYGDGYFEGLSHGWYKVRWMNLDRRVPGIQIAVGADSTGVAVYPFMVGEETVPRWRLSLTLFHRQFHQPMIKGLICLEHPALALFEEGGYEMPSAHERLEWQLDYRARLRGDGV